MSRTYANSLHRPRQKWELDLLEREWGTPDAMPRLVKTLVRTKSAIGTMASAMGLTVRQREAGVIRRIVETAHGRLAEVTAFAKDEA